MLLAPTIQLLAMLEALNKIPHGWLPLKGAVAVMVVRGLLILCLVPIGLVVVPSHHELANKLITAIIAVYFGSRIVTLLGITDRVDLGIFSSLLLNAGILAAFLVNIYFGLSIVVAALLLSLFSWIGSMIQKRRAKTSLTDAV